MSVSVDTFKCNFCGDECIGNFSLCTECDEGGLKSAKYCDKCTYVANGNHLSEGQCPAHVKGDEISHEDLKRHYDTLSRKYLDLIISVTNGAHFELGGEKYLAIHPPVESKNKIFAHSKTN